MAVYVTWWMCQLAPIIVHVHSGHHALPDPDMTTSDIAEVTALPSSRPCGESLCRCSASRADCSGHDGNLTYVPKLPDQVTVVDLSRNRFTSEALTKALFANLTGVQELDLSYNNISRLSRTVFDDMNKLTSLILDGNGALKPVSVREVLSIQTLESLSVQNCHLPPPEANLFENSASVVRFMTLASNPHGGTYSLDGFFPLPYLYDLDLGHCDFKEMTSSCPLKTLSYLDLSGNALRTFPRTCLDKETSMFPVLAHLALKHNRIDALSTAETCLPLLMHLDMSYNLLKSYPAATFSSLNFPVLETLELQHQSSYFDMFVVNTRIEDHAFDNPSLQKLDLRHNELDFADLGSVGKHAFANCYHVEYLYLNLNNFKRVDDQRFSELFGHFKSVRELLIANSKLEVLTTRTFAIFPALISLDLSDNVLTEIPDGAFDSLKSLDNLYLGNNKIETLGEHTFSEEKRRSLSKLYLGLNPFTCSCDLQWFRQWFLTSPHLFVGSTVDFDISSYRCRNLPGLALANFSLTEQACLLTREVSLFIIQASSIAIFMLTLVSLVFRYRWHLRLLMYEVFRGRDDLRRRRLQANNFDFDVFVSYASEDLPWVRQQLVAKLEGEMGLRLCVHERDFVPGKHIVDNIVQSVDGSKKILMVFSENFMQSQWCQFELTLCLSHVMDHDDALIVVCVDDVMSRQMTSAMMAVLKTTTYIQWREHADAAASFWGRLRLALNEVIPQDEHYV